MKHFGKRRHVALQVELSDGCLVHIYRRSDGTPCLGFSGMEKDIALRGADLPRLFTFFEAAWRLT